MLTAARHDAFDRAHVVKIASPSDGNVVGLGVHVVCGIQINPAVFGDKDGKPCVGSVSADHFDVARLIFQCGAAGYNR